MPYAFKGDLGPGQESKVPRAVTGHIRRIHRAHRYYEVVYEVWGHELVECFKF